ncbi:MAG: squalene/phytoene synthase family protein [Erythrobacter sp.]
MDRFEPDEMPLASRIALAYCAREQRSALGAALALDRRLSQLVARTSEPILGQMRLAWWREVLQKEPQSRPQGDAVLDAISRHWGTKCTALVALVDGWEYLLHPEPLDEAAASAFAAGRAAALVAACTDEAQDSEPASTAGRVWALADLAAKVSDPAERMMLVALGRAEAKKRMRLTPQARAIAVLGALGARALARGGRPLMEGRSAAATAIKAAILLR